MPGPDTPEVKALRQRAKDLGLNLHNRVGEKKLREAIATAEGLRDVAQAQAPQTQKAPQAEAVPPTASKFAVDPNVYVPGPNEKLAYTEEEYLDKELREARRNANRLVRVRVTCMNPNKKNWMGEILSVGSAKMGTIKKFVPFNAEEPYHVPYAIYQLLKERQCRIGTTVKLPNGQEVNRYKLINEFAVEVMPPLTQDELEKLKQRQAMAKGTVTS